MKCPKIVASKIFGGAEMTREERNNWILNIENTAAYIASEIGEAVVASTLYKYGASSIEQIASSDLAEVFSELYAIEADLRAD